MQGRFVSLCFIGEVSEDLISDSEVQQVEIDNDEVPFFRVISESMDEQIDLLCFGVFVAEEESVEVDDPSVTRSLSHDVEQQSHLVFLASVVAVAVPSGIFVCDGWELLR